MQVLNMCQWKLVGQIAKLLWRLEIRVKALILRLLDNFAKPFTSDKADGLGLGLFLSHSTITRFGGTVSLQQIKNGGTLTTLILPFDPSATEEASQ